MQLTDDDDDDDVANFPFLLRHNKRPRPSFLPRYSFALPIDGALASQSKFHNILRRIDFRVEGSSQSMSPRWPRSGYGRSEDRVKSGIRNGLLSLHLLRTLPLLSKAVVVRCVGLRQSESKTGTELPHAQMRRVLKSERREE